MKTDQKLSTAVRSIHQFTEDHEITCRGSPVLHT